VGYGLCVEGFRGIGRLREVEEVEFTSRRLGAGVKKLRRLKKMFITNRKRAHAVLLGPFSIS
jgi:hypothetical protein